MLGLEELGIANETVDAFMLAVAEEPFVLEDIAAELEISDAEARFILRYLIDHDIRWFKQIWVPLKK